MKSYLLVIVLLCSLQSCKKYNQKDDVLPPVTSTGALTFGFLFNETVWIRHNIPKLTSTFKIRYSSSRGLLIYCERRNRTNSNRTDQADFVFKEIEVGERILSAQNGDEAYILINDPDKSEEYIVLESGTLKISKMDTVNHIISGEFSADIKMRQSDRRASITQGRFDIVYDPDQQW